MTWLFSRSCNCYSLVIMLALLVHSSGGSAYDFAFEYQFQHVNRAQGLSQGTGYAINQDAKGFIWIGTQEGLNRFDGRRIKVFGRSDAPFALRDSYIYAIENDPSDPLKMWLGTHSGLHSYNHQTGQFHLFQGQQNDPISDSKIYAVKFVDSQFVWLGTGYGLNFIDVVNNQNQSFELNYKNVDIDKINVVYSIEFIDGNNLLLATPAGLFRFNLSQKQIVEDYPLAGTPIIWKLLKDKQGTIWIGTSNGVYHFKHNLISEFKLKTTGLEPLDKNALSFLQTRDSKIWIGTGSGLYLYDSDYQLVAHLYKDPEIPSSLVNNTVWSIFEDKNGIVWAGTDNGISRFNPQSLDFHTFGKRADNRGLTDNWVSSVYRSPEGVLWVGTNNGVEGFSASGKRRWHFNSQSGLSSPWVYSIYQQAKKHLWVGTYQGLNIVDLSTNETLPLPLPLQQTSLHSDKIWCFLAEGDNHLWIGSVSGLYFVDLRDGSFKRYSKAQGLSASHIYALHRTDENNIWIGTSEGLNVLDLKRNKVKSFQVGSKIDGAIKHKWITGITSDKNGRLWISTDGGIYFQQLHSKKFIYLENFEQTSQYVYSIEVDDNNDFWFSTNSGIGKLYYQGDQSKPLSESQLKLDFFTKNDGLQDDEYNEFASFKDSEGQIYFGGVNGLNKITPKQFNQRVERAPVAVITDFEINGKKVSPQWRDELSPIKSAIGWTEALELEFYQNYLTFYLAALDFANPKSNRIQYRMLGFDDSWKSTTDNQPFVNFQRLSPGEYIFQVRSANARSGWGSRIASLSINISPPFWMSGVAYFCYLLFITGLIFWSYRQYKLRLRRLQQIVNREQQVAARLIEVDAIKDQFLANASHELKTPLNAIIGLSEYLIAENLQTLDKNESKEVLGLIRDSGSRMNELVEDILQCSTLNQGKLNLSLTSVDLWLLVEECIKEVKITKSVNNLAINNSVPKTLERAKADKNRIKQVLLNLINNAVKFTHEGSVTITAENHANKISVRVIDTGIGIEPEFHENIFEAFVQVDGTFSRQYEGSGLGLSIVKQLVELHGGEVKIYSQPAVGTTVEFSLLIYSDDAEA